MKSPRSWYPVDVRFLTRVVIFVVAISIAGAAYQYASSRSDARLHPPPGVMVRVGETQLHLHCLGEGSPTIVLEAGRGEDSTSWQPVHESLSSATRTCAYDRAGLGWSDYAGSSKSYEDIADELRALLGEIEVPPPYVIAGHSFGGIVARSFYKKYPDEVAGIALIDSSHENQDARLAPLEPAESISESFLETSGPALATLGILRLTGMLHPGSHPAIPDELQKTRIALRDRSSWIRGVLVYRSISSTDISIEPPNLGQLPLLVVTAGDAKDSDDPADAEWLKMQKELAALSSVSRHIIPDGTTHYVQFDNAPLVVEEIFRLLDVISEAGPPESGGHNAVRQKD